MLLAVASLSPLAIVVSRRQECHEAATDRGQNRHLILGVSWCWHPRSPAAPSLSPAPTNFRRAARSDRLARSRPVELAGRPVARACTTTPATADYVHPGASEGVNAIIQTTDKKPLSISYPIPRTFVPNIPRRFPEMGEFVSLPVLGGMHHRYERCAA